MSSGNFTMTLRGQAVTVTAAGDGDVTLTSANGQELDWEITEDEWFLVLQVAQDHGHETDFWAYRS